MKYYKNTELATIYHVSEKSVRNWIDSTLKGRLDLELHEENGRTYIANTTRNMDVIKGLVEERKKFTNSRGHKLVTPKPEFYKLYTDKQILDIARNIDIHKEIPQQYNYFDGGAQYWDKYAYRLLKESGLNSLTSCLQLLNASQDYIVNGLCAGKQVNVVDLALGNSLPVKPLLEYLVKEQRLNRYIGIDFSGDILRIAERHIKEWFDDKIKFEDYRRDITQEAFDDIITGECFDKDGNSPINLVVLFGGLLSAVRSPIQAINVLNNSMGKDDVLIYCKKLDSENSRRYFDFNVESDKRQLTTIVALTLDMLNIDESLYDVEQTFDSVQKMRSIRIKPKVDITLDFVANGSPKSLQLKKGEAILLWRSWHQTATEIINQFESNGFDLLYATSTSSKEYLLTAFKIKSTRQT